MSARFGPGDGKRRPAEGPAGGSEDHQANGIDTRILRYAEFVGEIAALADLADEGGWGCVDLGPELGLERQAIGQVVMDCGDGTELVANLTRRPKVVAPTLLRCVGRR